MSGGIESHHGMFPYDLSHAEESISHGIFLATEEILDDIIELLEERREDLSEAKMTQCLSLAYLRKAELSAINSPEKGIGYIEKSVNFPELELFDQLEMREILARCYFKKQNYVMAITIFKSILILNKWYGGDILPDENQIHLQIRIVQGILDNLEER